MVNAKGLVSSPCEKSEGNRTNEENAYVTGKNVFRLWKTGASELRDLTLNINNRELATTNPTESVPFSSSTENTHGNWNRNTDNTYTNLSQQRHCSIELWWVNSPSFTIVQKIVSLNRNVLRVEKTRNSLLSRFPSSHGAELRPFFTIGTPRKTNSRLNAENDTLRVLIVASFYTCFSFLQFLHLLPFCYLL